MGDDITGPELTAQATLVKAAKAALSEPSTENLQALRSADQALGAMAPPPAAP
jgi:hypothetical protein